MSIVQFFHNKVRKAPKIKPSKSEPDDSTFAIPPGMGRILIPSAPALPRPFLVSEVNLEIGLKLVVCANKPEDKKYRVIAPAINFRDDYIGDWHYKPIWLILSHLAAYELTHTSNSGGEGIYKSEICRGAKINLEGPRAFEMGRKTEWSQIFNYLTDGLRTKWSFSGEIWATRVPYRGYPASEQLVEYFNYVDIPTRLNDKGEIVFRV